MPTEETAGTSVRSVMHDLLAKKGRSGCGHVVTGRVLEEGWRQKVAAFADPVLQAAPPPDPITGPGRGRRRKP